MVRKLVSGSPVADVISPCPASRSRSSQVSHTVRLRRLEREKEGENKLYACVTFGVARFVKKGEWWGREGGPAPGPRGHRRAVCPRCVARARADYASPFTVHQHLRLLRANTPTALFRSCALYLLRLSPLIPLATTTPFNTHARTHPSAPHATNSLLEKDFVPISLSNIQTRPWFKIRCNMIVTPFALLSFSRGREPLFHSSAAIKNIYTSYETTSRNIRRASRMHEY